MSVESEVEKSESQVLLTTPLPRDTTYIFSSLDWVIVSLIFVGSFALTFITLDAYGPHWDSPEYLEPALRMAHGLKSFFLGTGEAPP